MKGNLVPWHGHSVSGHKLLVPLTDFVCVFPVAQSCLTLVTPWTAALQDPLFMGLSRREYWSGLPFPSPGDLPDPGNRTRISCIGWRVMIYSEL